MSNTKIEKRAEGVAIEKILEKRTKKNRLVYEFSYVDGSKVIYRLLDTRVLTAGAAFFVGLPSYCPVCKLERAHVNYYSGAIRCISCGNHAGENDNRPFAKILAGRWSNAKKD